MPNTKKGFTLVELLVVISIIAILATVGVAVYSNASKSSRDAKRRGDIQEIRKALEQWYATNNSYPTLLQYSSISSSTYFPSGSTPKDPNNSDYNYYAPDNVTCYSYLVCATLELATGNRSTTPTGGCDATGEGSLTNGTLYCAKSLQR